MAIHLTARETQVLEGLKKYKANKEIANDLNLSERTVKFHVSSLLAKAGVSGRMALVTWDPRVLGEPSTDFGYCYSLLSERDKQIIKMVALNLPLEQISKLIGITTIRYHVLKIYYALGITPEKVPIRDMRYEVTRSMYRERLITEEDEKMVQELKATILEKQKVKPKLRVIRGKHDAVAN